MKKFSFLMLMFLASLFAVSLSSCSKDDDAGMKVPRMNKQKFFLSTDAAAKDSLYEIFKQPYHIFNLGIINAKNNEEEGRYINLSKQEQNVITDEAGNQIGEIKYGKNDVLKINIYNFCTLKRQMDSEMGKTYIITPSANKRNDIYISLNIMLDKGIGYGVEIH